MPYTVAQDLERVDRIARKLYGTEREGNLELLLAANPGIAGRGPYLPRGTQLDVPAKPAPRPSVTYQRPWD